MDLPHLTRPGIVVPVRVDPTGRLGPTRAQARGRRWRQVAPWYHVPAETDSERTDQRIVEAIAPLPPGSAATGWAALHWLGARWFDGTDADGRHLDVQAALGHQHTARYRPGVDLTEDWLFDDDVIWVDGLPITVPLRSVSYLARWAPTDLVATRHVDMAAYDDLVTLDRLAAYGVRLGSRPGIRRLRRAIAAADENAWSPMEVSARFTWHGAFPGRSLSCNRPVFDLAGNHLFTPDLLDVEAGVAGEYNGTDHGDDERRRQDLVRDDVARRHGIEVVTTMAGPRERERFLHRLRGAYGRAGTQTGPRTWTIEQPDGWVDTSTVASRLALTPYQRDRWLRYRRRT